MNCKQGDLAIVVRSYAGNEGKIVTCLKLLPAGSNNYLTSDGVLWETDVELNTLNGFNEPIKKTRFMPDSHLRPLRGDLSEDDADLFVSSPAPKTAALNHE